MAEESTADRGALFRDSNVLVRLPSGESRAQAEAAARALDTGQRRIVSTDLIVAEFADVLSSRMPVTDAATQIQTILDLESIEVVWHALLADALATWSATNIDFPYAYLAALTRQTRDTAVLSFDRDFDPIEGVERVDPATY